MLGLFSGLTIASLVLTAVAEKEKGAPFTYQNKDELSLLVKQELKFNDLVKEYEENPDQHLTISAKELKELK